MNIPYWMVAQIRRDLANADTALDRPYASRKTAQESIRKVIHSLDMVDKWADDDLDTFGPRPTRD